MMTWDDTERNRRRDEAAEWSWYSVERIDPLGFGGETTLASQIGERLRLIYGVAQTADAPAAVRHLMEELEAKGV